MPGRVTGNYDRFPATELPTDVRIYRSPELWATLATAAGSSESRPLLVIDTYPGVDLIALREAVSHHMPEFLCIDIEEEAAHDNAHIEKAIAGFLTPDPVLGVMSNITIDDFYNPDEIRRIRQLVIQTHSPTVVIGWGASQIAVRHHTLVLADLPRWEIQQRHRAGAPNWRANNSESTQQEKFKRGYFVEWRAADRHKKSLLPRIDYLLDTTRGLSQATALEGRHYREALKSLTNRPFRVVPFFDPGVWGGEWMRERFDLDPDAPNFAWCFDCVPEENSLRFSSGDATVETPALNLVLTHPQELLGQAVFDDFGAEFPIRFDMLDTMGGQNLSLQVHPLTDYIQQHFAMPYTQDESYYILDATENSTVYLGVKTGVTHEDFATALRHATDNQKPFVAEQYVNQFPVKKHDHISIPAGTVHCSGANTMVLEISATPYIFTFKLWDWDRVDLNGTPRPLHHEHGLANIQWNRDTDWVTQHLLTGPEHVSATETMVDERTGLHNLEFIETRRCWFSEKATLHTQRTVTVMTLVEGDIVIIESPDSAFPPFPLRYAETVIIPAGVGAYTLNRSPDSRESTFATIRAWVRGTEASPSP